MRSLDKLLDHLYQSFSKDPKRFLAFRLRYDGTMRWDVAGGVLTTTVTGGSGRGLTVDLAGYTLATLVAHLASQAGYSLTDTALDGTTTALVLLDGGASQDDEPGLYGHASVLFGFLKAYSVELNAAEASIAQMLLQMQTRTATGEWLDFWGSYYDVPRLTGEFDVDYQSRIVPEVIRPRENNVAIAMAINEAFLIDSTVVDAGANPGSLFYNGLATYGGTERYAFEVSSLYGLFDVAFSYDLEYGIEIRQFVKKIRSFIDRFRAAGTQLRLLRLVAAPLLESIPLPTEAGSLNLAATVSLGDNLADSALSDKYNGLIRHDGSGVYASAIYISDVMTPFLAAVNFQESVGTTKDALTLNMGYSHTYNSDKSYNGLANHASGVGLQLTL